jgi:hypothetical protein
MKLWRRLDLTPSRSVIVVGDDLFRGLTTPQEPPTQAALDEIVSTATRVAVREVHGPERAPLLETAVGADLESLRAALRIRDGGTGHCMCLGTLVFDFWRDDEQLGAVTLHHGESLRWEPFFDNARLVDPNPVLDWLSERGIKSERRSFEADRREAEEDDREAERWRAHMPQVLQPLWPKMQDPFGGLEESADMLERVYPDAVERARILFEWNSNCTRSGDGVPVYEEVPIFCLLRLPLPVLVEAAQREPRSAALLDGAIWFFTGWSFCTERASDRAALPRALAEDLVRHARRASDRRTRRRAKELVE